MGDGIFRARKEDYAAAFKPYFKETTATRLLNEGGMDTMLFRMGKGISGCFQAVPEQSRAEVYYVLRGVIALCPLGCEEETFGEGDAFSFSGRSAGTVFRVLEDLELLCCANVASFDKNLDLTQHLDVLLAELERKDGDTRSHCERVRLLAMRLAEKLSGFDESRLETLLQAARFHDIGKCQVPLEILVKPQRLTDAEFAVMKKHSEYSEQMVREAFGPEMALILREHHERVDGGGYPDGLRGEEIHLSARIIAVADAYDAMVTSRPYHKGIPPCEAMAELRRCAGKQFDPACVEALCRALEGAEAAAKADVILQNTLTRNEKR